MKTKLFQASLFAFLMAFFAITQTIAQQPQIPQIPGSNGAAPPAQTAVESQPAQSQPVIKKEGVKRIGIVMPKAQMAQTAPANQDVGESIKQTIISYLSGPALDIVPLTGRIPAQIIAEAKEKQCDYILFASVTQKKGSGGFGGLMKMAGPMVNMIPNMGAMGGGSGMSGVMAGAVTQTIVGAATQAATQHDISQQMATISGNNIKAKDEISLEYKLVTAAENALVVGNTLKQKAKQNGEDVITPLVEQLANTVLETATQNK